MWGGWWRGGELGNEVFIGRLGLVCWAFFMEVKMEIGLRFLYFFLDLCLGLGRR